jgi:lipopolysaccharide export system permease protein
MFNIKEKNSVTYTFLQPYTNEKLVHVINNYNTLGHHENSRYEVIKLLNSRGVSTTELREKGLAIKKEYDTTETISKNYKAHSTFAITLYSIGIILLVLFFVFKNNKLPSLQSASIQLSIISLFLYIVYYLKSIFNLSKFYNHINKRNKRPSIMFLIIGLPLYMITYFFLKSKIKEDLKQNCLDSLK